METISKAKKCECDSRGLFHKSPCTHKGYISPDSSKSLEITIRVREDELDLFVFEIGHSEGDNTFVSMPTRIADKLRWQVLAMRSER